MCYAEPVNGDIIRKSMLSHFRLKEDSAVGIASVKPTQVTANRDTRVVWGIATMTDIDAEDEVVVAGGAHKDSRFFTLKNVFVDHKYDFGSGIGRLRKHFPTNSPAGEHNGWKIQFDVLPLQNSKFAADVLTFAERDALTFSIGMMGMDYGKTTTSEKAKYKQGSKVPVSIVRAWDWLETSVTLMPCNLRCRQLGYGDHVDIDDGGIKRLDIVDNLLCRGSVDIESADALGFSSMTKRREIHIEDLHKHRIKGTILIDG